MSPPIKSSKVKRDGLRSLPGSEAEGVYPIRSSGRVPRTTNALAKFSALKSWSYPTHCHRKWRHRKHPHPVLRSLGTRSPCLRSRLATIEKVTESRNDIHFQEKSYKHGVASLRKNLINYIQYSAKRLFNNHKSENISLSAVRKRQKPCFSQNRKERGKLSTARFGSSLCASI